MIFIENDGFVRDQQTFRRLNAMLPEHMDDGLTWAWALYWSASMQNGNGYTVSTSAATSTVSTEAPEERMGFSWENGGKMDEKWMTNGLSLRLILGTQNLAEFWTVWQYTL